MVEQVNDEETLFRNVRANSDEYVLNDDGSLKKINSTAFGDKGFKISVDREILLVGNNILDKANNSKISTGNGIIKLIAGEDVRSIEPELIHNNMQHLLNIKPYPLENNKAHALIFPTPNGKGVFKKLQKKLAMRALKYGWIIAPQN